MGLDTGHEFVGTERLYDVVVGTEAQAPYLVDVFLPGRYEDDGNILRFADRAADLEPVPAGQHDVEDDEVIGFLKGLLLPRIAVKRHIDGKAVGFQVVPFQFSNALVVFND